MSTFINHIPKLSKIIPGLVQNKPRTPEALRKLLEPVNDLDLDDTPASDCGSEISDIFADLHTGSMLSHAKGETPIPKQQADWMTMELFTDNFKETMKGVRREMKLGENMLKENPEEVCKIFKQPREKELSPKFKARLDELLRDRNFVYTASETESELEPEQKDDSMNGEWTMLDLRCKDSQRFRISSANFDAFRQKEPHWLDRPKISWKSINDSKLKCEKWLSDNYLGG